MAITRPVSKTLISTTQWGIPITDAVNANTDALAAMKPTPWTNVTFQNGWANYGSGYQPMQYRKVGDIVYVRGFVAMPGTNTIICTLPSGFWAPYGAEYIATFYNGSARQVAVIVIGTTGYIQSGDAGVMGGALGINLIYSTTA